MKSKRNERTDTEGSKNIKKEEDVRTKYTHTHHRASCISDTKFIISLKMG